MSRTWKKYRETKETLVPISLPAKSPYRLFNATSACPVLNGHRRGPCRVGNYHVNAKDADESRPSGPSGTVATTKPAISPPRRITFDQHLNGVPNAAGHLLPLKEKHIRRFHALSFSTARTERGLSRVTIDPPKKPHSTCAITITDFHLDLTRLIVVSTGSRNLCMPVHQ